MKKTNCEQQTCNKDRACFLLGECAIKHNFFVNKPDKVKDAITGATTTAEVLELLAKHANRRYVLPTDRRKKVEKVGPKITFLQQIKQGGLL